VRPSPSAGMDRAHPFDKAGAVSRVFHLVNFGVVPRDTQVFEALCRQDQGLLVQAAGRLCALSELGLEPTLYVHDLSGTAIGMVHFPGEKAIASSVFVLGSEDAWNLFRKISAHNWGWPAGGATETSAYYCDPCKVSWIAPSTTTQAARTGLAGYYPEYARVMYCG